MTFASPYWLYGGVVGAIALALALWAFRISARRKLAEFADNDLLGPLIKTYSPARRLAKDWLVVLALMLLCCALARPQYGYTWEDSKAKGIDIAIALDVSKSMLAEDIKPSRLERAKLAVMDFIARTRGDRVGLVAFAGTAFLQCPLTLDYDALRLTLEDFSPKLIPMGGTNIAQAIEEAAATLSSDSNYKIIVLITDGEDLTGEGLEKARELAKDGFKIYTVGVGSEEGSLIPIRQGGDLDYLRDNDGNAVKSRLDVSTLETIASVTGGFYVPLGNTGEGLSYVYEEGLGSIPAEDREAKAIQRPIERFGIFLAAGVILLLIDSFIGTRKRPVQSGGAAQAAIMLLVGLAFLSSANPAEASVKEAAKSFEAGDFDQAIELYQKELEKEPADARMRYNLGVAQYRNGNFAEATESFKQALSGKDTQLQADAFYNSGNAKFRLGQALAETEPEAAISTWEEALEDYDNAIELDAENTSAPSNRDIVSQRIEQLKKMMEQQQQQQDGEGDDSENSEDQEKQDGNQQQDGEQQNQDQQQQGDQQDGEDQQQQNQQGEQGEEQQDGEQQEQQSDQQSDEQKDGEQQDQQQSSEDEENQEPENHEQGNPAEENQEQGNSEQENSGEAVQMTPEEAMRFLRSQRQDEKRLPATLDVRETQQQSSGQKIQDW